MNGSVVQTLILSDWQRHRPLHPDVHRGWRPGVSYSFKWEARSRRSSERRGSSWR